MRRLARPAVLAGAIALLAAKDLGAQVPRRVASQQQAGPSESGWPLVQSVDAGIPARNSAVLSIAEAPDGWLFVGAEQVAAFDGQEWQEIPLGGATGVRALAVAAPGPGAGGAGRAAAPARIWVGAVGDLGYLSRSPTDRWAFTSLLPQLQRAGVPRCGDVWLAHPSGGFTWFVTTSQLLRWDGSEFMVWPRAAEGRRQTGVAAGHAWVYQPGEGVLALDAAQPRLAIADAELPAHPVLWIAAAGAGSQPDPFRTGVLIGAGTSVYRRTGGGWREIPALAARLRDRLPVRAEVLADGRVGIATFLGGLVLATAEGEFEGVIDSSNGLADNNVTTVVRGTGDRLWLGLGGGLARVDGLGVVSLFDARTGLTGGTFREAIAHDGRLLLLTSRGMLTPSPGSAPLAPLSDFKAVLWDALSLRGRLWVGGFGGIWTSSGSRTYPKPVRDSESGPGGEFAAASDVPNAESDDGWSHVYFVSADVLRLAATRLAPNGVLFTKDYTPTLLAPSPRGWIARPLGPAAPDTPLSLVEDAQGSVWLSTTRGDILRYAPSGGGTSGPTLELKQRYRPGYGLREGTAKPRLLTAAGKLFAWTETDLLAYDPALASFRPVQSVQPFAPLAAAADSGALFLLVQHREGGRSARPALVRLPLSKASADYAWEPVDVPGIDDIGPLATLDCTSTRGGDALWIGGARGLLRVDLAAAGRSPPDPPPPARLRLMRIDAAASPLPTTGQTADLPSSMERLVVQFTAGAVSEGVTFQTRLVGAERSWTQQSGPAREFTGLAPGRYTFRVRAVDRWGRSGPEDSVDFVVPTPWYAGPGAVAACLLLAIAAIAGVMRWRLRVLRRSHEKLERLVSERTRELALANTAKGEFLENISHELRNPLTGITGLVALLKEERLLPEERRLVRSLRASAGQLRRVMEEVLSFSKFEYGAVAVEARPFRMLPLLEEIRDLHAPEAESRGNTVSVHWQSGVGDAFIGDAPKIRMILANFVSNALKYAPGTPVVISGDAEDGEGGVEMNLEVTDGGPGVPADEQSLIFQKFVRGARAKAGPEPGTGIGLAACRALARLMDGSVGVESPVAGTDRGATFFLRVRLPRPAARAEPAPPEQARIAAKASRPARRVLIVDDQEYNRTVLSAIVAETGADVRTAAEAGAALAEAEHSPFDVVFLDWELPGLKGTDIARILRQRSTRAGTLIIATTAHDSDQARARCIEAGMDGFVLKPYEPEEIRRILGAGTAASGSADTEPAGGDAGSGGLDLRALDYYSRRVRPGEDAAAAYESGLDDELALLTAALAGGATDAVAAAAHRLRSHAALVGARDLQAAAKAVEQRALAGELGGAQEEFRDVSAAAAALRAELRARSR